MSHGTAPSCPAVKAGSVVLARQPSTRLFVAVAAPAFAESEQQLVGRRLRVGAVTFDVVSPITRCVTPSYDIATGEPDVALHRTIVAGRGNIMGIYCRVIVPGTIVPGAAIEPA